MFKAASFLCGLVTALALGGTIVVNRQIASYSTERTVRYALMDRDLAGKASRTRETAKGCDSRGLASADVSCGKK